MTAGSLGAIVLAVVLSPIAPVGPIREVEPDRGVAVDLTVLLGGFAVLLAILVLVVLAGAALVVRQQERAEAVPARGSLLGTGLQGVALRPAAAVGVREGLGAGSEHTSAATRSTLASCTLSIIALVATLTFGASLDGLIGSPDRYGWAADRALVAFGGYIGIPPEAADALAERPEVASVAAGFVRPRAARGSQRRARSASTLRVHQRR